MQTRMGTPVAPNQPHHRAVLVEQFSATFGTHSAHEPRGPSGLRDDQLMTLGGYSHRRRTHEWSTAQTTARATVDRCSLHAPA